MLGCSAAEEASTSGPEAPPVSTLARLNSLKSFNIQNSTFSVQHSTSNIQHSTSKIQHSASNIQHSTFNIQHPTSNIQHSTSNIQHSTFVHQPWSVHSSSHSSICPSIPFHCFRKSRKVSRTILASTTLFLPLQPFSQVCTIIRRKALIELQSASAHQCAAQ